MRRRARAIGGTYALVALAGALSAGGMSAQAAPPTGALSSEQLVSIALQVAEASGDARPVDIQTASGPLKTALRVESPDSTSYPPTASSGPEGPGDANSTVYLVAMRGRFFYNGPQPPRRHGARKQAPSQVLELIINANGFVEGRAWMHRVPVALSHLGPVTNLYYLGELDAAGR